MGGTFYRVSVLPNSYASDLQFTRFYDDKHSVRKNKIKKYSIFCKQPENLPERNIICHLRETRRRFVFRKALW